MTKSNHLADEELVRAYVGGDMQAFDTLLERTKSKLFAYILFIVRNEARANDVFQETFLKAIVKLQEGKYNNMGKFLAWTMRIAHNIIMDEYRNKLAQNVVSASEDEALLQPVNADLLTQESREDFFVREQTLQQVKRLMNALPEKQREVVYMRFWEGLSFKEIAQVTGTSINTSLGRMRYGVNNMRRMAKRNNVSL